MPGYQFTVTLTLKNPQATTQVVTIPRGTVIEPESTHLSYQSAIVARDYTFHLKPHETRSVLLDAECWNRQLAPPKGVPGKLTGLKGEVKKQADVWSVSSSPKSGTVLTSPSQDAHVFGALANTTPDLARDFLVDAIENARHSGANVEPLMQEARMVAAAAALGPRERQRLVELARDPLVHPFVSAERLRAFLVRAGNPAESCMNALIRLSTDIFASSAHRLAKTMYESAAELSDLLEDKRLTIKEDRRRELGDLARTKVISMLDALPLLDEIPWS